MRRDYTVQNEKMVGPLVIRECWEQQVLKKEGMFSFEYDVFTEPCGLQTEIMEVVLGCIFKSPPVQIMDVDEIV